MTLKLPEKHFKKKKETEKRKKRALSHSVLFVTGNGQLEKYVFYTVIIFFFTKKLASALNGGVSSMPC